MLIRGDSLRDGRGPGHDRAFFFGLVATGMGVLTAPPWQSSPLQRPQGNLYIKIINV
jgi:hypothetical protein